MKKPNFFIVGAPKCGTTALYEYLKTHPNIFLSQIKEPGYFIEEIVDSHHDYRGVRTIESYMNLFSKANDNHIIIGEASVGYLASATALKKIYNFTSNVKIIAMLRNPLEIAYSLHNTQYFLGHEKVKSFKDAWYLQESRMASNVEESAALNKYTLQYGMSAKIGEQVERLFNIFDESQIKLILFEDFISSTENVYVDVLNFLGVPQDGKKQFPKINESKLPYFQKLNEFVTTKPGIAGKLTEKVKSYLGVTSLGVGPLVNKINQKKYTKKPLQPEFKKYLIDEFRDDIELLSVILKRDLSNWLK